MKLAFLIIFVLLAGCAPTAKKPAEPFDFKKIKKGESPYYYFLMSQLKKTPEKVAESEAYLDRALKKDKDSSYLWAEKALRAAERSQFDKAIAYAERSLKENPSNVDTLILLGKLHAARHDPEKALTYYRRAWALDRGVEELYNLMAREYLSLNQQHRAIQTLKACRNEIPEAMSCLYYLATIELQRKNFNEALGYFNHILELNPSNSKILQTIGEIYLQKKNYRKAIDIFRQLKQLEPQDVTRSIRLGLIYYELKEVDRAIAEFLSVYKRFPESDRINYFLGLLYFKKKDFERAYHHFDSVKADSPFFKESFNRMVFILRQKGDLAAAVALLNEKVGKKDRTPDFYALKVSFLIFDGDYKRALSVVNGALSRFEQNTEFLFQRGVILDKLNRWEEAKEDFKAIIAVKPNSAKTFNYLGYTMLERGENLDEAMVYIRSAHKLAPNDGNITDSLAWAYFKKGDTQKALSLLKRANKQKPDEPTILEHLGDVYFSLKNKRAARSYYQKALRLLEGNTRRNPEEEKQIKKLRDKLGKF